MKSIFSVVTAHLHAALGVTTWISLGLMVLVSSVLMQPRRDFFLLGFVDASSNNVMSWCGDGRIDGSRGEECDDGLGFNGPEGLCSSSCTRNVRFCGDGICDATERPSTCCADCGGCDISSSDDGLDRKSVV